MSSDAIPAKACDLATLGRGLASEGTGGDDTAAQPGVPTMSSSLRSRRLPQEGDLSVDLPQFQELMEPTTRAQAYDGAVFPAPPVASSLVTVPKSESPASPNVQQNNILGDATIGLGTGMVPYDPIPDLFPANHWDPTGEAKFDVDHALLEGAALSAEDRVSGIATVPTNSAPHYGAPASEIFDFNREFDTSNAFFANNNMSEQRAPPSDPIFMLGEDIYNAETDLLAEDALSEKLPLTVPVAFAGQHQFKVELKHKLPRSTMEDLNRAAKEGMQKNFYDFAILQKPRTSHRAPLTPTELEYDDEWLPSTPCPTPPRKKVKLEQVHMPMNLQVAPPAPALTRSSSSPELKIAPVVDHTTTQPQSGLIRDAYPPAVDDYTEAALVWRVANSDSGRQTNFTFRDHYGMIRDSLHEALVNELNRKLRVGLNVQSMHLIRNMPSLFFGQQDALRSARRIYFAQTGLQRRIDWMSCTEHQSLIDSLDWNKPNLSLEEMDRLVKAAGVWVYDAWQAAHPGMQRRSH